MKQTMRSDEIDETADFFLICDGHVASCAGCPGVVEETVLLPGHGFFYVRVPACWTHNAWRAAIETVVAKSGLRFVHMTKAKKLFQGFREKPGLVCLRLTRNRRFFLAEELLTTFPLRRYWCDLCHKCVEPEVPRVFKFPEIVTARRDYRDRARIEQAHRAVDHEFETTGRVSKATMDAWMQAQDAVRVDYYDRYVPGKMKSIRSCKHCVRYRLPRERKDQLWRQQRIEDRKREKETMEGCKNQIRALKQFLKEGNPEVLQSLPKEFGPAEILPTSCRPL